MYEDGGRVNLAAAIPLAPMAIKPLAAYLGVPVGTLGVMESFKQNCKLFKRKSFCYEHT